MHLEIRYRKKAHFRRSGTALVVALVTLLVISSLLGTIIQSLLVQSRQSRQIANQLQANWLADAALANGTVQLRSNSAYEGETWRAAMSPDSENEIGVAEIRVTRTAEAGAQAQISVEARYPDHAVRRAVASRTYQLTIPKDIKAGTARSENTP